MTRETSAEFARDYVGQSDLRETGYSGTEEGWRHDREVILDAVDKSGIFLDLGSANGRLAFDVRRWAAEKGINLEVYGVDFVPELIEKARQRFPEQQNHFEVGDVNNYQPKVPATYIRTELSYFKQGRVEAELRRYIESLAPGGKLLVTWYDDNTGEEFDRFIQYMQSLNLGKTDVYENDATCVVAITKPHSSEVEQE